MFLLGEYFDSQKRKLVKKRKLGNLLLERKD